MLFYEVGLEVEHDVLRKDLILAFGYDEWCEKDPYADRENEELDYNWQQFKHVIKHKARYVFLGSKQFKNGIQETPVDEILNDIGRRADNLNLFTQLVPGTLLYRCRQHRDGEVLDKAKQLTAPPYDKAIYPNRMSPAGISMFYCAFDIATCHAETISKEQPEKQFATTVAFMNKKDLFLLDLTKLPALPSIFDPVMRSNYFSIKFLHKFVEDLSKPISKNGREHIEYVPTQVVTEYFRYTYEDLTGGSLDGIIYPSSKLSKKNACVLFYDHQQSLDELDFLPAKLTTSKVL
jgi:RES domain-containing protein